MKKTLIATLIAQIAGMTRPMQDQFTSGVALSVAAVIHDSETDIDDVAAIEVILPMAYNLIKELIAELRRLEAAPVLS